MTTSAAILRKASAIVISYLRVGPHYVNMCRRPLDADDWYVDSDSVIKICRDDAQKLLDRATSAEEEAQALMELIEQCVAGRFVRSVYRSRNWSHASSLLKEFLQNTIRIEAALARTRLEYLENYQPAPQELDFSSVHALEGNYHDDVEHAFEELNKRFQGKCDALDPEEFNYAVLLLIYGSCFAVSQWCEVDLHNSSWNSFKASLEGYFIERAGMLPGESRATDLPGGGMTLSHHVPSCWEDMEVLELRIRELTTRKKAAELYCSLQGVPAIQEIVSPDHQEEVLESLRWLLNQAGTKIVPKVLHAFGDEF